MAAMQNAKYQYKLLGITMNDGTILRPDKLMVLVGPNNVGKSRVLKEIMTYTTQSNPPQSIMVSAVEVNYPSTLADLRVVYDVERYQDNNGNWIFRALNTTLSQEWHIPVSAWPSEYEREFDQRRDRLDRYFAEQFGQAMVAFLTTEARLHLVREGDSPSDHRQASTLLQMLYNSGSSVSREISNLVTTQVRCTGFSGQLEKIAHQPVRCSLRLSRYAI
jgi:ATPase subunit of ABC transporter with duplicated ATPase domains